MLLTFLISTILGTLSGLGVGGGSLLLLWMTVINHLDYQAARFINLLFFLPAAMISCIANRRILCYRMRVLLPAAFFGCAAALTFSRVSRNWDIFWIRKCFGVVLLITAIRELHFSSPKNTA